MFEHSEIITRHVNSVIGRKMAWGTDDCVLFVAGLAKDLLGVDVLGNAWRGRWTNKDEALAALPLGLGVVVGRRMRDIGWVRCSPADAQFGAIAIVRDMRNEHALGFVLGTGRVLCRGEMGVVGMPTSAIVMCWAQR